MAVHATGKATKPELMVAPTYGWELALKMTLQAQRVARKPKQPPVGRTVRLVAGGTPFFHRLVLPDKWSPLLGVAAEAQRVCLILHTVRDELLSPLLSMRIVAIHTRHLAPLERMAERQGKFHPLPIVAAVAVFVRVGRKQIRGALFGIGQEVGRGQGLAVLRQVVQHFAMTIPARHFGARVLGEEPSLDVTQVGPMAAQAAVGRLLRGELFHVLAVDNVSWTDSLRMLASRAVTRFATPARNAPEERSPVDASFVEAGDLGVAFGALRRTHNRSAGLGP